MAGHDQDLRLRPPPAYVGERLHLGARPDDLLPMAGGFSLPRRPCTLNPRNPDAPGTRDPEDDALRQVPAVPPARAARPHLARPADQEGAAVVLGRPPRRQPGAHRPDGPGPQAPHVRHRRGDGLQGDRGRLPVGQPARLRLHPPAHRGGPRPRRRHHPGAHAVPARADRAHLRVPAGRQQRDRPLLQLDVGPPAPGGVRPRQGRHHPDRHRRRQALQEARAHARRAPTCATSTARRASPAPRSTTPSRSARR